MVGMMTKIYTQAFPTRFKCGRLRKHTKPVLVYISPMLVQGIGTCLNWKNKHYAELRTLIGQRDIIALNSSETDLKQIISLNKELTTQ